MFYEHLGLKQFWTLFLGEKLDPPLDGPNLPRIYLMIYIKNRVICISNFYTLRFYVLTQNSLFFLNLCLLLFLIFLISLYMIIVLAGTWRMVLAPYGVEGSLYINIRRVFHLLPEHIIIILFLLIMSLFTCNFENVNVFFSVWSTWRCSVFF